MGDWASKSPINISLDFVRQFAQILVTRLLPLRAVDLAKWSDDPEDWMNDEEADRWEFELRVGCPNRPNPIREQIKGRKTHSPYRSLPCRQPCAEHVLHSLLSHYRADLGPSMAGLLQQASGMIVPSRGCEPFPPRFTKLDIDLLWFTFVPLPLQPPKIWQVFFSRRVSTALLAEVRATWKDLSASIVGSSIT